MKLSDYFIPTERVTLRLPAEGFVRRNACTANGTLMMLHGCAGLGKTLCLARLAEDWGAPAVYLSLRREDDDSSMLTAHLCRALEACGAASFAQTEAAAPTLFSACIRTIAERKLTLLIDNIDAAASNEAVRLLEALLEPAGGGDFCAAAAGRRMPSFLARRMMDGTMAELTARELLFGPGETAAHIALRLPPDSALIHAATKEALPAAAEALHAFAGGFPAAEAMILAEIARSSGELALTTAVERSHLREFVDFNLLGGLDAGLAAYVRKTAFLGTCPAALCREALGERHPGEKTARLAAEGLILPGDDRETPDFPPAIRQALAGMLSDAERHALTEAAVGWYTKNGCFAEALHLLEEYGEADMAEHLLAKYGTKLIENREFSLIGYCSDIIERHQMPSDPAVLGVLAQHHYYCGRYDEMERALNAADAMFGKENYYSVCRGLYNGLLKFEKNPALYTANICRFAGYLTENGLALPFLQETEKTLLEQVLRSSAPREMRPLRLRRFGGLSLTVSSNGREVPWRTRKAAEFTAFMLERGGSPIERDRLLGVLWGEEMPDSAVAMLHNIIYGLRQALPAPECGGFIAYRNKCYTLDTALIADEDDAILSVCREIAAKNAGSLPAHAALFDTYWGSYLAGIDADWARAAREYYDRLFTEGCLMLASHLHASGAYGKELVYLNNAAAVDPYSERITRERIRCHAAQGYPNRAKACYDAYCRLIGEELGLEPGKWLKREYLACFSDDRG